MNAATAPAAEAPAGADQTTEVLDLGNDLPTEGGSTTATTTPAQGPAQQDADGADDAGKGGGQGIPRQRLNEVNEKRRMAEEQLAQSERENAELRAQLQAAQGGRAPAAPTPAPAQAPTFDVAAAEREYTNAMMEGDGDKAAALREQINQHIEDRAVARFENRLSERQGAALVEDVASQVLAAYPWLNEPGGEAAMDAIVALRESKEAAGMPRHEALAFAVNLIAPRFAPTGTPSRESQSTAAPVDSRLKAANERGAAHSLLQPPAVQAGMGNRADPPVIDSSKLTDDQFNALPEDEKRKHLGY